MHSLHLRFGPQAHRDPKPHEGWRLGFCQHGNATRIHATSSICMCMRVAFNAASAPLAFNRFLIGRLCGHPDL